MTMSPNTPDLDALLAHGGWVRSLACSLVADPATADDVEQQAWVIALENPPSHDRNLRSWWSSVVRSSAGKGWREQKRRREVEDELADAGGAVGVAGASESVAPEDLADRFETFQRLAAAVSQLQQPYGSAIYLRFFEELTLREIAKRQGVSLSTSRARVDRGLEKLRGMLQQNLGSQWRSRCQIFALPISAAPWYTAGPAALITMALKTPLGIAATVAAAASLILWSPWQDPVPSQEPSREIRAELVAQDGSSKELPSVIARNTLPNPSMNLDGFATPATQGARVTVVDSNGGGAMPGAEVIVLDMGIVPMDKEFLMEAVAKPAERLLLLFGERYLTDENAQVLLPKPVGQVILVGRTEQYFGALRSSNLSEQITQGKDITLSIDYVKTVPVRVVDESGKPLAGADVSLFMDGNPSSFLRAETNEKGLAWIKILPILDGSQRTNTFVSLNILSPKPILTPVDLNKMSASPLEVVMPPTGRVEIHLPSRMTGSNGQQYFAGLSSIKPKKNGSGEWETVGEDVIRSIEQGVAIFPYVALDQNLRGLVASVDYSKQGTADQMGPLAAGETVVLDLNIKQKATFVVGRVLNTEGMVAKNLTLSADIRSIKSSGTTTIRRAIQTNAEGLFRLQMESNSDPRTTRSITVVMRKTKRKARRIAEKKLSGNIASGETNLGDFIVETPAVLVQGKVLSADGIPVANATVELDMEDRENDSYINFNESSSSGMLSFSASEADAQVRWQKRGDLRVNTDSDGNFAIYEVARDHRYRLRVRHADHKKVEQEFAPTSIGLEVFLGSAMTIEGHILLDSHIPVGGIYVSLLKSMPGRGDGFGGSSIFADSRGRFKFRGEEAGDYALRIESVWLGEEFFFVPVSFLQATDGKYVFPDIDLRGQLHTINASIFDEKGNRIAKGHIDGHHRDWPRQFEFQPLKLVSMGSAFDMTFTAEGKRRVELKQVRGHQEVVMHEGIPVNISISNMDVLPPDWDLMVRIIEAGSATDDWLDSTKFDKRGSAATIFECPGDFHLEIMVKHARNNDSLQTWTHLPGNQDTPSFTILDQKEGQQVFVELNPSALEEAMQAAREKAEEWDKERSKR